MRKLQDIPIKVQSGDKYQTEQGFTAIKDGIKSCSSSSQERLPKPKWLRVQISSSPEYQKVKEKVLRCKGKLF